MGILKDVYLAHKLRKDPEAFRRHLEEQKAARKPLTNWQVSWMLLKWSVIGWLLLVFLTRLLAWLFG